MAGTGPVVLTVKPVLVASLYTTNDAMGGLLTFALPGEFSRGGVIDSFHILDKDDEQGDVDIVFADSAFTPTDDHDPIALLEAEMDSFLGSASIVAADYVDFGEFSAAIVGGLGIVFEGKSVFAQLVARSGMTYSAVDDLTVRLGFVPA